MGKVIRPLAETKIGNYSIFPERFTLEECGEYHFHYRSVRIAFTPDEFKDFLRLTRFDRDKKEKIFLSKVMRSNGDVIDKNRLVTEYTKNTYIKHRKDSAKEADFFKEPAYIHVHYRNLRLEMPIEEFVQVANNFENARNALPIQSIEDMFCRMENLSYVVIRNFENLPDSVEMGKHSDLDLLFASRRDAEEFVRITNAERTFKESYRVQHKVVIGDSFILCDLRVTGDNYFPTDLSVEMVNSRKRLCCFWIPQDVPYSYGLAYHAHIHKKHMKDDYKDRIIHNKYHVMSMYKPVRPNDKSVGFYA